MRLDNVLKDSCGYIVTVCAEECNAKRRAGLAESKSVNMIT
jgi:hypothetical protein